MGVRRGAVSLIVNELLKDGSIVEGATGDAVRGRKPTFLYIDSRRRAVVAIDIRVSQTLLMLADLVGQPIGGVVTLPTERDPKSSSSRWRAHQAAAGRSRQIDECTGIGVAVPGMVERPSMRVLHAPTLGWRDVDLRDMLAKATGCPSRSKTRAASARSRSYGRCTAPATRRPAISSSSRRRTVLASA